MFAKEKNCAILVHFAFKCMSVANLANHDFVSTVARLYPSVLKYMYDFMRNYEFKTVSVTRCTQFHV